MKKGSILVVAFILISSISNAQSLYEEAVSLPTYNANNSEMFLIDSNADWSHINDPDKKYFFVIPGNYSSMGNTSYTDSHGRIEIKASGTATNKRYIILHNGNDTHTGKLNRNQLAKVRFVLQDANYWVIDRMAYWESPKPESPIEIKNSDHNIINRYFIHNVGSGIYVFPGSDYNTIQNCRIERNDLYIAHDRAGIGLYNNAQNNISIKNTKVLNNEVYNFVDGFQTIRRNENSASNCNFEGTIVDHNHFYIDNTIYTDGHGNHDPNGNYAYAENGMDLKVGSENPTNPMIISNNIMWGFRQSDLTLHNGFDFDLGDSGAVMPMHYNINNTIIRNNISFDSAEGFSISDPKAGYSMRNSIIKDNIFYNIKKLFIYMDYADNVTFTNNLCKEITMTSVPTNNIYWSRFHHSSNLNFSENMLVNTGDSRSRVSEGNSLSTFSVIHNAYYQSSPSEIANSTDIILKADPTLDYDDFVFFTDRHTNNPRKITIPKIIAPKQNQPPTATNVSIEGTPNVGQTLTLNYNFSDPDGDAEGESIIAWSTSTKELQRSTSKTFVIPEGYCEGTIGAWIHPKDSKGNMLKSAIAASNNMLKLTCKTTDIEENTNTTFGIYPNPVENILTITHNRDELKNYTITNMLGQRIAIGILPKNEAIDIHHFRTGTYFIELSNDQKSITKKFIKL